MLGKILRGESIVLPENEVDERREIIEETEEIIQDEEEIKKDENLSKDDKDYFNKVKIKKLFNLMYYFYEKGKEEFYVIVSENKGNIEKSLYVNNHTTLDSELVKKIYLLIIKLGNINFYNYLKRYTPKYNINEYLIKGTNYMFFEDVDEKEIFHILEEKVNSKNENEEALKRSIQLKYLIEELKNKDKYTFIKFNYDYTKIHKISFVNVDVCIVINKIINILKDLCIKNINLEDIIKLTNITINNEQYEVLDYTKELKNLSILFYMSKFRHLISDVKTKNYLNRDKIIKNNHNPSLFPLYIKNNFSYDENYIDLNELDDLLEIDFESKIIATLVNDVVPNKINKQLSSELFFNLEMMNSEAYANFNVDE